MQKNMRELESSPSGIRRWLAELFAFLFFVFMLLPQGAAIWRPPYLLVFLGFWFAFSFGPAMVETFRRIGPLLLLLAAQCGVILTKYLIHRDPEVILGQYINGYFFLFVSTFFCGHYLLHYPETLRQIRVWGVVTLAIATSWALPEILSHPGIGRLTVSGDNPRALFAQGIPGYGILYTIPVVFVLLCSYLDKLSRSMRYIYAVALVLLVTHVLLSTFTLATVLMIMAIAAAVLGEACVFIREKHLKRLARISALETHHTRVAAGNSPSARGYRARVLAVVLASVVLTVFLSKESNTPSKHLNWSRNKATRLMTGMVSSGLKEGDETGRGKKMAKSLGAFRDCPFFGCEFKHDVLKQNIGWHSDLVDPFALYGIVGYMPMILFHIIIIRCGLKTWFRNRNTLGGIGELAAWVFYGIICFWNTATLTVLPTALLFMQFVTPPNDETSEKLPHARALDN